MTITNSIKKKTLNHYYNSFDNGGSTAVPIKKKKNGTSTRQNKDSHESQSCFCGMRDAVSLSFLHDLFKNLLKHERSSYFVCPQLCHPHYGIFYIILLLKTISNKSGGKTPTQFNFKRRLCGVGQRKTDNIKVSIKINVILNTIFSDSTLIKIDP